jgi:glycosyltransferase involved in cell wall biosynthesis
VIPEAANATAPQLPQSPAPEQVAAGELCLSVIVPAFNSLEYISPCVNSIILALTAVPESELILVDNGSTDGTYELLMERFAHQCRIIHAPGISIAEVRNTGARAARGKIVSFVDSDCIVPPDHFIKVSQIFQDTDAGVVGGTWYELPADASWVATCWVGLHQRIRDGNVNFVNGCNLSIRRGILAEIGGFDPELVTGEETELCQRVNEFGYDVYASSAATVTHLRNPTSLADFFAKELWRGLGMFGTFSLRHVDKPVWMTATYLFAAVIALLVLVVCPGPLSQRVLLALALINVVPVVTVAYRAHARRAVFQPARAVILYHAYYLARVGAMLVIAKRALESRRRRKVPAA